jgi:FtsH-binding integral membrane protein
MDVVVVVVAIVVLSAFGVWIYGLSRAWRFTSKRMTRGERRAVALGLGALLLLPIVLAIIGVSERVAMIAIAVVMAFVLLVLIAIGTRDHRRREQRIAGRRSGASSQDD